MSRITALLVAACSALLVAVPLASADVVTDFTDPTLAPSWLTVNDATTTKAVWAEDGADGGYIQATDEGSLDATTTGGNSQKAVYLWTSFAYRDDQRGAYGKKLKWDIRPSAMNNPFSAEPDVLWLGPSFTADASVTAPTAGIWNTREIVMLPENWRKPSGQAVSASEFQDMLLYGDGFQFRTEYNNGAGDSGDLDNVVLEYGDADGQIDIVAPATATWGDTLPVKLKVTNIGPETARGLGVVYYLPASREYVSSSQGCGKAAATVVTCNIEGVANGAVHEFTVNLKTVGSGTVKGTDEAVLLTSTDDPVEHNNQAFSDTTVSDPAGGGGTTTTDPDTDGDGFKDSVDKCKTVKGTVEGCPPATTPVTPVTPVVIPDTAAPVVQSATAPKKLPASATSVAMTITPKEAVTAVGLVTTNAPIKVAKVVTLGKTTTALAANVPGKVTVKFSTKAKKAFKKSKKAIKILFTVTLTDKAGNKTVLKRNIVIKGGKQKN
jgi:hypothetical protein